MTDALRLAQLELESLRREDLRRRARTDLLAFVEYTKPDYQTNWHHAAICTQLERWARGEIKRLIVVCPPRHGKSELVSRRLPAWLFGTNPNARVIATSYGQDLANSFSLDVKNIMSEPAYGELFEGVKPFSKHFSHAWKTNTVRNWHLQEKAHRGYYLCAGVRGGISGRGMTHGIIDDPFKDIGQANSATVRAATWAWYWSAFWTRKAPGASILITTTRWHLDDLVGKLLNSKEQLDVEPWTVIDLPAEMYEDDTLSTIDCDPREPGEYLWPGRYSADELAPVKRIPDVWNGPYQGRPTSKSGGLFKEHHFKRYDHVPEFSRYLMSIDCSFGSVKASASDVCIQLWGQVKDAPAFMYLLDEICDPMEFDDTLAAILRMMSNWRAVAPSMVKLVELKANGAAVVNTLRKKVPGIVTVSPTESKYARAVSISPTVASGCVFVPVDDYLVQGQRRATFASDYIDQHCAFPFGAKDDRVDCTSQALDYLVGKAFELLMGTLDDLQPEEIAAGVEPVTRKPAKQSKGLTMSIGKLWH